MELHAKSAWAGLILLLSLSVAPCRAVNADDATDDQTREMTSVLQAFMGAVAAKDGDRASRLASEQFLKGLAEARDLALDADEARLRRELRNVRSVMKFRIYFRAEELMTASSRQLYAAWVDKGLAGSIAAARFYSTAVVAQAVIGDEPGPVQAHAMLSRGDHLIREATLFAYEDGGWRIAAMPLLDLSEFVPPCLWTLVEAGSDPPRDSACGEQIGVLGKPIEELVTAVTKGGASADEEFARLHRPEAFDALMHHRLDPHYWQPMRPSRPH